MNSLMIIKTPYRYYVLVATCVFARKAEWLRNACLAATLLFPAVAALHSIVLAAVHVNGVFKYLIDIDILTADSSLTRRGRYGCLWSLPVRFNWHLSGPSNGQAIPDILL